MIGWMKNRVTFHYLGEYPALTGKNGGNLMIPKYPYYSQETQCKQVPITFPPQHQDRQPGLEYLMCPLPIADNPAYKGSGKLAGKVHYGG